MASTSGADIDDWETLEDDFPAPAGPGNHYPGKRANRRAGKAQPLPAAASAAPMTRSPKVWIMCILGLSVFWCMISLLAISRLEKRLPSELQEQLEFHATFSGLWPRTQPGTLGPNATAADLHHLPFAEASLGHKPRKQKPSSGPEEEEEEAASPDMGALPSADKGPDFLQQHPPQLAADNDKDVADADWSIWRPLVTALSNAFVAEDSERQMLRGLLSLKAPVQDQAAP